MNYIVLFFYQEFENERIFKVQTILIIEFFIIIVSIIINSLITSLRSVGLRQISQILDKKFTQISQIN